MERLVFQIIIRMNSIDVGEQKSYSMFTEIQKLGRICQKQCLGAVATVSDVLFGGKFRAA